MPDTLAHGAFHTLLAIRQCGADTELLFDVVSIVVHVAVLAVDERRIVIIVPGITPDNVKVSTMIIAII